jgi:multidrug efflux system membrane fusion protein
MTDAETIRRQCNLPTALGALAGCAFIFLLTACSPDSRAAALSATKDKAEGGAPAAGARSGGGSGGGRGAVGAVPVTVATVVEKALAQTVGAIGTVEALSSVDIRAQVTGQLIEVLFKEGQDVTAGQPLFRLDPRPFEAALRQAEAILAKDKATASRAEAEVVRNGDLLKRGLIPRDQYDALVASSTSLQATLAADAADVETAKLQLQYTSIDAPIPGRTGALMAHKGDLVRANDTTSLVVINQVAPIYVSFAVPARLLPDIRKYNTAGALELEARSSGTSQPPSVGAVSFIDNAVDATTGTIRLKGTFPNRDLRLWPGLFVDVTMRLTIDAHAIVAPSEAVQAGQQGQYVYLVKPDKTVEARTVIVSRTEGGLSVIGSGLQTGDQVVTDGQLRLAPGTRVTIKPAAEKGPAS